MLAPPPAAEPAAASAAPPAGLPPLEKVVAPTPHSTPSVSFPEGVEALKADPRYVIVNEVTYTCQRPKRAPITLRPLQVVKLDGADDEFGLCALLWDVKHTSLKLGVINITQKAGAFVSLRPICVPR